MFGNTWMLYKTKLFTIRYIHNYRIIVKMRVKTLHMG